MSSFLVTGQNAYGLSGSLFKVEMNKSMHGGYGDLTSFVEFLRLNAWCGDGQYSFVKSSLQLDCNTDTVLSNKRELAFDN